MEQPIEPKENREIARDSLAAEVSKWQNDMVHWQVQLEKSEKRLEDFDDTTLNEKGQASYRHFAGLLFYYSKELLPHLDSQLEQHHHQLKLLKPLGLDPYKGLLFTHQKIHEEMDVMETTLRGYLREVKTWMAINRGKGNQAVRKMLILTDYNSPAQHASDYAITLFGDQAKDIVLLNVSTNPYDDLPDGETDLDDTEYHEQYLYLNEKRRIVRSFPDVAKKIKHRHETGPLVEVIKRTAHALQADLIVIGTMGERGIGKSHLGSITATVIKQVAMPTLVVPEHTPLRTPDQVMLAIDPLIDQRPQHLDLFTSMREHFNARLDVLLMYSNKQHLDSVHERLHAREVLDVLDLNDATLLQTSLDDIIKAIEEKVHERSSDIVCLLSHHHNWLHFTWGRDMAEKMLFETHIPLLILHQEGQV